MSGKRASEQVKETRTFNLNEMLENYEFNVSYYQLRSVSARGGIEGKSCHKKPAYRANTIRSKQKTVKKTTNHCEN